MALLEILDETDDLDKIVDAVLWSYEQLRRSNTLMSREDRVIAVADTLLECLDHRALAVVAADLMDRLSDAARRDNGWEYAG